MKFLPVGEPIINPGLRLIINRLDLAANEVFNFFFFFFICLSKSRQVN